MSDERGAAVRVATALLANAVARLREGLAQVAAAVPDFLREAERLLAELQRRLA